jgi:UDP-N-acetylmuramoyl-tripeptide--D-alanyl-D-alanine ligase
VKLPLFRIVAVLNAVGDPDRRLSAEGYSIDSRTLRPGELFFAIRGERLDGHDFVEAALSAGAVAAVVRRDQAKRYPDQSRLLAVDDTLVALQQLGAAARRLWHKPLIAVTGSAGKTTTKEAIAALLSSNFRVFKSAGNLNNQFGVPLMLLGLEPEHDIAVVELGMSHAGEIRDLANIAAPETGVVTSVAPVHLENFDSLGGIARAKYELIEALPAYGTAVLNADDELVAQFGADFAGKVVTFGVQKPAGVRAENVEIRGNQGSTFELVAGGSRQPAALPLIGAHNIYNALAGVAVALERGLALADCAAALRSLTPADKRGQVIEIGGMIVINDCYNSNPKALDSMVDVLANMPAERRIVVAGEMLELGPAGEEMHRACALHMARRGIDLLLGVRGLAEAMVDEARNAGLRALFVADAQEAGQWLARETRRGDVVLLKASRGVRLERALESWKAHLGAAAANVS